MRIAGDGPLRPLLKLNRVTSPTARQQWQAFSSGVADRHIAPVYARHWFKTYDNAELESVSVTEHYLPVPVMDTLIVLLTIPEDELARLDSDH
jgi:hypothetical protein